MYLVDFARGIAYRGRKGFIIMLGENGLYIKNKKKVVPLTIKNIKVMEMPSGAVAI